MMLASTSSAIDMASLTCSCVSSSPVLRPEGGWGQCGKVLKLLILTTKLVGNRAGEDTAGKPRQRHQHGLAHLQPCGEPRPCAQARTRMGQRCRLYGATQEPLGVQESSVARIPHMYPQAPDCLWWTWWGCLSQTVHCGSLQAITILRHGVLGTVF